MTSYGKPKVAAEAESAADHLEEFFDLVGDNEEVGEYLSEGDIEVLVEAHEILRFFDQSYTTDKRGY